jgi:hypothetical protein
MDMHLVGYPELSLISIQEVPVIENHMILKEQKTLSTCKPIKHLRQVPAMHNYQYALINTRDPHWMQPSVRFI